MVETNCGWLTGASQANSRSIGGPNSNRTIGYWSVEPPPPGQDSRAIRVLVGNVGVVRTHRIYKAGPKLPIKYGVDFELQPKTFVDVTRDKIGIYSADGMLSCGMYEFLG